MRFICPEIDPQSAIKDLYKVSSNDVPVLNGALQQVFYTFKKGITEFLYSKASMKKYLSSITESTEPMSIAEYATYSGISIVDNLGTTIEAMDFYFQSAELTKLRTEMWLTIFTDSGLAFYKPERLATSAEITTYDVIENIVQEIANYGFFGETGYDVFSSVVQSDTINAATIDDDLKTIIVNTNKAAADILIVSTGIDANPFDYIKYKGKIYLVVSKKEENGLFKLFCVREVTSTYTFTQDDVTNPNVAAAGGGVTSFNSRTGAVTPQAGDYSASDVGLGNVSNVAQLPASYLDTDGALTANSDTKVASQKATKTYADGKVAKATNITALNDTGIADGEIAVFNLTNKDIRTSDKTITTSLGADDTTVPTSKAVKDVTDGKAATNQKLDDFGTPDDNTDLDASTSRHGLLKKLDGNTSNFLRGDGTWAAPSATVTRYFAIFREEQSSGTHAGTFTSGDWRDRVLNTTRSNNITGVSLSSNVITLPAGTYRIFAAAPVFGQVGLHKIRFYNTADSTEALTGQNAGNGATGNGMETRAIIDDILVLAAEKTFKIQHRCETTVSTNGLGIASSWGTEIYTTITIEKIA